MPPGRPWTCRWPTASTGCSATSSAPRTPRATRSPPSSSYLGLIEGGKIGGEARAQEVHAVMTRGDLATVKGTLTSPTASFDCTWSLVRGEGGWQVVQDLVVFEPR